jgi:hypothetical protein
MEFTHTDWHNHLVRQCLLRRRSSAMNKSNRALLEKHKDIQENEVADAHDVSFRREPWM